MDLLAVFLLVFSGLFNYFRKFYQFRLHIFVNHKISGVKVIDIKIFDIKAWYFIEIGEKEGNKLRQEIENRDILVNK